MLPARSARRRMASAATHPGCPRSAAAARTTARASVIGPISTRRSSCSRWTLRSASCSAMAPPSDQPTSTTRSAPRPRAYAIAASTSCHSRWPSRDAPHAAADPSPSPRYETTSDVIPIDSVAGTERSAVTLLLPQPWMWIAQVSPAASASGWMSHAGAMPPGVESSTSSYGRRNAAGPGCRCPVHAPVLAAPRSPVTSSSSRVTVPAAGSCTRACPTTACPSSPNHSPNRPRCSVRRSASSVTLSAVLAWMRVHRRGRCRTTSRASRSPTRRAPQADAASAMHAIPARMKNPIPVGRHV